MDTYLDQFEILASTGIPPSEAFAEKLSFGLDDFLGFWVRETLGFLQHGGSELRFIEGPYGRGKTHLLLQMARLARQHGFATALVNCSSESKPFASIQETYRSLLPTVRFPDTNNPDGAGIFEYLSQMPKKAIANLKDDDLLNPGYRHLLVGCWQRLREDCRNRRVSLDLQNLIRALPENRVTLTELYRMDRGLTRPIGKLTKRNAMSWLRGLFLLPRIVGFNGFVVLFDETGADFHLGRSNSRERRQHLANLRNLVDYIAVGKLPGCAVTYAVAADLLISARETLPPLVQRIERMDPSKINPRAVWCNLDELTRPGIDSSDFWQGLGQKIIGVARVAGYEEMELNRLQQELPEMAKEWSGYLHNSSVREFIKKLAGTISN